MIHIVPTDPEQIAEEHRIDYIHNHVHDYVAARRVGSILGKYLSVIDLVVMISPKQVYQIIRSGIDFSDGNKFTTQDMFDARAILGDEIACKTMLDDNQLSLDIFGVFGYSRDMTDYRVRMIRYGMSRGGYIYGKAVTFVRKNADKFTQDEIDKIFSKKTSIVGGLVEN